MNKDWYKHTNNAGGVLKPEDFDALLKTIYEQGASPDIAYFDEKGVDRMWRAGMLTRREYLWLKLKFKAGRLKRSVTSGVQSVLRTIGLGRTV